MKNYLSKVFILSFLIFGIVSLVSCSDSKISKLISVIDKVMIEQDQFWSKIETKEIYTEKYISDYNSRLKQLFEEYYKIASTFSNDKNVIGGAYAVVRSHPQWNEVAQKFSSYDQQVKKYSDLMVSNFLVNSNNGIFYYWLVRDSDNARFGGILSKIDGDISNILQQKSDSITTKQDAKVFLEKIKFLWLRGENNEYATFLGQLDCKVSPDLGKLFRKIGFDYPYKGYSQDSKEVKEFREFMASMNVKIDNPYQGIYKKI